MSYNEHKTYKCVNILTGEVIATRVKIAHNFKSRSVGLLNRVSIAVDEGLLITPCNSIHTFFMKFPIDVLFLDKNGAVVRAVQNLMPWRLAGALMRGFMVLELSANKINEMSIKTGSMLKFE